jgi:hypothetical protein
MCSHLIDKLEKLKKMFGSGKPALMDLRKLCFSRDVLQEVYCGYLGLNDAIIKYYFAPSDFNGSDSKIPTSTEKLFAENMMAVIDLTINHEIGIGFYRSINNHDVDEIILHGSLDNAIKHGFWPKAIGWEKAEKDFRKLLSEI